MRARPHSRSVFGSRAKETNEEHAGQSLAPCPCGDAAVWYRITPPPTDAAGRALSSLGPDQITENLCEGCFVGLIPSEKRTAWARFGSPVTAMRERRRTGEDQSPRFDPFEVSDVPASDD